MGPGGSAIVLMSLLTSGYLFNFIFHPFRFFTRRAEGQRLFFMSAGSGIALAALVFPGAAFLKHLLPADSWPMLLAHAFASAVPVPHANKLFLTLVVAALLAYALNLASVRMVRGKHASHLLSSGGKAKSSAQCVYDTLTERHGTPMAQLLRRAADQQKLVMLTLKSRKIYCGRIFEVSPDIDSAEACLEILPSFSAYRDKDTLKMGDERTEYPIIDLWVATQRVYSLKEKLGLFRGTFAQFALRKAGSMIEEHMAAVRKYESGLKDEINELEAQIEGMLNGRDFDVQDWVKVIPLKEVESASFHDAGAYSAWFAAAENGALRVQ